MSAEQGRGALFDRPGQESVRRPFPQRTGDRHGLDHVADRAEADDKDAGGFHVEAL